MLSAVLLNDTSDISEGGGRKGGGGGAGGGGGSGKGQHSARFMTKTVQRKH
jgi:hypothetical protein